MIIAIYGKSCTGKTVVAKRVAQLLNARVRCCGEEVRSVAREHGFEAKRLSVDLHLIIDNITRHTASCIGEDIVIEGRFLPYVCCDIPGIVWIELRCNKEVRAKRYLERKDGTESGGALEGCDLDDQVLIEKLYPRIIPSAEDLIVVDTSTNSIDDVVNAIIEKIRSLKWQHD